MVDECGAEILIVMGKVRPHFLGELCESKQYFVLGVGKPYCFVLEALRERCL